MTEQQLLVFLAAVTALVIVARIGGEIAARFSIPVVVGEIAGGIILGPSVFGALWPEGWRELFPTDDAHRTVLDALSWIGVIFVVLLAGLHTRFDMLKTRRRSVFVAWLGGFLIPFVAGFALGLVLPEGLIGPGISRSLFALFVATAMSISAIPVIARILSDLGLLKTRVGGVIMATAVADDTIGWMVLAVISGVATHQGPQISNVLRTAAGTVIFVVLALTLGRWLVAKMFGLSHKLRLPHAQTGLTLALVMAGALTTQALGVHLVLGAFVFAVLIGGVPDRDASVDDAVERIGMSFFAPFFFAYVGLKVDLTELSGSFLTAAFAVLAVACLSKIVGGGVGARLGGLPTWEAAAVGAGRNARGAMEMVIAAVGASLGIIAPPMYATIVLVAVVTSLMAGPMIRYCMSRAETVAQRVD